VTSRDCKCDKKAPPINDLDRGDSRFLDFLPKSGRLRLKVKQSPDENI
jgi:hypothetical protein